ARPSSRALAAVDGNEPGLCCGGAGRSHHHSPRDDVVPSFLTLGRHNPGREIGPGPEPTAQMGFRDTWHRTLVYFGLADDEEYEEEVEPYHEPEVELQDTYRDRPNVRRLSARRRRDEIDDIFADDPAPERRTASLRPVGGG